MSKCEISIVLPDGKIRYAPKETSTMTLNWQPGNFYLSLQMVHVGPRLVMYSWPEDQVLNSYTTYAFSTSYRLNTGIGRFILTAAVNNLSDEEYVTLYGYPEPPRSFRISLNYEIDTIKKKGK